MQKWKVEALHVFAAKNSISLSVHKWNMFWELKISLSLFSLSFLECNVFENIFSFITGDKSKEESKKERL